MIAPRVVNGGALTSPDGQVSLVSSREVTLTASAGDANSIDSDLRGLSVSTESFLPGNAIIPGDYVNNTSSGLIQAPGGYISLQATFLGAVLDCRRVDLDHQRFAQRICEHPGRRYRTGAGRRHRHHAGPKPGDHPSGSRLPGGLQALADPDRRRRFHQRHRLPDRYRLQQPDLRPERQYLHRRGPRRAGRFSDAADLQTSRVFIDIGAVIDAAGLTDVTVPASQNSIKISPVTQNELSNDPNYRQSFLNGATALCRSEAIGRIV